MIALYIFTSLFIVFVISALWFATYLFKRACELAPYYAEKATLEQDIATAKRSLSQTRQTLEREAGCLAQAKLDIAQGETERQWLQNNQGTLAALKGQIASTQYTLDDVTDKLKRVQDELQVKNDEHKTLLAEWNSCRLLLQSAETKLKETQLEQKTLDESNAACSAKLQVLTKKIAQIDVDLTSKKNEVSKLEQEECKLSKTVENLNAEIKKLGDARNSVKARVSELEYELSGLVGKEKSYEKKWEDLDRKVETINISAPEKYREQEWLAEFEQNLKDCHFRFDNRLIRAFHTSLKVADCSPLVVLSGISGTGKSLLPELYAHAIGMNFLQVPVQPRWDSPQDMLGFYNYMEHRYKATELSRLLWQSDKYNNKERAKENPAMNMILLDEMNLARVEYYFSDMLSKLEVRRGLDPSDRQKRRAAEIVLESSATGGTEDIRRIFVGFNNLFIGTMNEDESTQSLSDKVKDRANVLRFGRPKELSGVSADKEAFFKLYSARMMTEERWQGQDWRNYSGDSGIRDLGKRMDDLNMFLAKLGRPFAHRMWNAVVSYIVQYPGDKEDAWIDQVEMKMLPKLTGLDMAEPATAKVMGDLGNYLDALNEPELKVAFDSAKERDFFTWQGIQR